MSSVPLHEIVRPGKNRDDVGKVGESLFALAGWLEEHKSHIKVPANSSQASVKRYVFACKPPIAHHNHWSALLNIARNART